jgi:hypothetical protein
MNKATKFNDLYAKNSQYNFVLRTPIWHEFSDFSSFRSSHTSSGSMSSPPLCLPLLLLLKAGFGPEGLSPSRFFVSRVRILQRCIVIKLCLKCRDKLPNSLNFIDYGVKPEEYQVWIRMKEFKSLQEWEE